MQVLSKGWSLWSHADTRVFTTASSPLPHEAQPIKPAEHKPQTTQELTGTVAYRAGCGTQLSVVLFSYCKGYSCCYRAVSLNATGVCCSSCLSCAGAPHYLLNAQLFNVSVWKALAPLDTSSDPQEQAIKGLLKRALFSNMGWQWCS